MKDRGKRVKLRMKKMNNKGFTLIELLAVITIMGILMMIAIPNVTRTIENSRRDTFADIAHEYIGAIRNGMVADTIECQSGGSYVVSSALPTGDYYFVISTVKHSSKAPYNDDTFVNSTKDLMESGGVSPFGNAPLYGYVRIQKTVDPATGKTTTKFSAALVDTGEHGFNTEKTENEIKRAAVSSSDQGIDAITSATGKALAGKKFCKVN